MPLICSACHALDHQVPMDRSDRKWRAVYFSSEGKHKIRFSVCAMCDTLMNMNRWEQLEREMRVTRKHLQKKALEGGA